MQSHAAHEQTLEILPSATPTRLSRRLFIVSRLQCNVWRRERNTEDFMLRTRITEQYGLKVPFINTGMAFIATAAPLARAVCNAGGMGMLGIPAMPPDVLQAAIRDVKAVDPACPRVATSLYRARQFLGSEADASMACSLSLRHISGLCGSRFFQR